MRFLPLLLLAACFPSVDANLAEVPGGAFVMGCNAALDAQCNDDEKPAHAVNLKAFSIDRFKVSQQQYDGCVRYGVCAPPGRDYDPVGQGNLPVNWVTWEMAAAYCAWAGKRLPTEAERELAARGFDGRIYPWGNDPPDCAHATFTPPEGACSPGSPTTPIGAHPLSASPFGAFDLAGNVWEWVSDWYDPAYYAQSPREDPGGPATGTVHVKRGGSFQDPADRLRTSRRWFHGADAAQDIGFRCVQVPQ